MDIEIPEPLPYPGLSCDHNKQLLNNLIYLIKPYPLTGFCLVIVRAQGHVCIRIADWSGTVLEPEKHEGDALLRDLITAQVPRLTTTMHLTKIPKAAFYFATNGLLVDLQVSLNKFVSPGFLADIFGKQGISAQERVGDPLILTPEKLQDLADGDQEYYLKPSKFKFTIREEKIVPVYGLIKREAKNAQGSGNDGDGGNKANGAR